LFHDYDHSRKIKDRNLEGKTLWNWSLSLDKKGSVEEAITWDQEALKIYEGLKNPQTAKISAKITEWSGS
tara:strand:- start:502 stop:711 length:210 start_codon:yes stop_codon:yes gene_type:complete